MKRTLPILGLALIIVGLLQPVTNFPPMTHVLAESNSSKVQLSPANEPGILKPDLEPIAPVTAPEALQAPLVEKQSIAPPQPQTPVTAPLTASQGDNKSISWNFFVSKGLPAHQIAGIMGNLQQEHNFNTSDTPGGLGIAQWMGARRANLLARPDPYSIHTQLNFLWDELHGPESAAMAALKGSPDIGSAVRAFQNKFERCGDCREGQRIQYAQSIYSQFVR